MCENLVKEERQQMAQFVLLPWIEVLQRRALRSETFSETIFDNWKLLKNDEKYSLFHLKIYFFRSQDI